MIYAIVGKRVIFKDSIRIISGGQSDTDIQELQTGIWYDRLRIDSKTDYCVEK